MIEFDDQEMEFEMLDNQLPSNHCQDHSWNPD
jgi:hypothetical protein